MISQAFLHCANTKGNYTFVNLIDNSTARYLKIVVFSVAMRIFVASKEQKVSNDLLYFLQIRLGSASHPPQNALNFIFKIDLRRLENPHSSVLLCHSSKK